MCTLWKIYMFTTTTKPQIMLVNKIGKSPFESFKMEVDEELKRCYGSYRFKLSIIVMSMSMLGVSYRMSISFAIVCMVNHTAVHDLKVESSRGIWMNETIIHQLHNETDDLNTFSCELQTVKDPHSLEVHVYTIIKYWRIF